jgi:hypothetical protein
MLYEFYCKILLVAFDEHYIKPGLTICYWYRNAIARGVNCLDHLTSNIVNLYSINSIRTVCIL